MSAEVRSLEQLAEFQAALVSFAQRAREALCSLDLEIRRSRDWVEEQLTRWEAEIRRCEEAVFKARQELARRRLMRIGDRPVDCTEQELALAKAQQRLGHAEEKRAACRAWVRDLPELIAEYDGQANPMQNVLESDLPRMLAFLERKREILEAYAQLSAAPPAGDPA